MNKKEAQKVIKILLECDGGCEYCSASLLKLFCKEFPDYIELSKKSFQERFGKELDSFDQKNIIDRRSTKVECDKIY